MVLPVLLFVILAVVTVAGMVMEHMAVGQAAENGVEAWIKGHSTADVRTVVDNTLTAEGYHNQTGVTTTLTSQGTLHTVLVTFPEYAVGGTHVGQGGVARSMDFSASSEPTTPVGGGGGAGGGGGGGGIIYHHFPMW